jgi:hypothetical protein
MTIEISPLELNDVAVEKIEAPENIPSEPPPSIEAPAKSRGRPKGSVNKKKVVEPPLPELPPPPPSSPVVEVVPEKKKPRERKPKAETRQEPTISVQASEAMPSSEDIHRARLFEIHDRAKNEMERRQARYTHMLNSRISSY